MKKFLTIAVVLAFVSMPAEGQFFKKLFKRKAKTEVKATVKDGSIDDDAQVAMADVATFPDNHNNRNGFLRIPLGIEAERFEKLLLERGFTERKHEDKQTAKTYFYEGEVYGAKSVVTLAVSEQTARVYAVDVVDLTVYPSLQAVKQRYDLLKKELTKEYGSGYVDNQGEAYTIQSRLGTVNMHYERNALTTSYTIGFALDDAKAYRMAYQEMEDKEYETAPRTITDGLAAACNHTDLVGLGVALLQNKNVKAAHNILLSYDYVVRKKTTKTVKASFVMDSYVASVTLACRKQTVTTVTMTANDDRTAICRDLQTNGFVSNDEKTWKQDGMTAVVSVDKQGRVVMVLR